MILLDTDHLTVLPLKGSVRQAHLVGRMAAEGVTAFRTSIISADEQLRGWLASIARERKTLRQVKAYDDLGNLLKFLKQCEIVPFDTSAAAIFDHLVSAKLRVSTNDLKIASVALANDDLLLTANRRDFEKVPGLRFENWMDPPPTP